MIEPTPLKLFGKGNIIEKYKLDEQFTEEVLSEEEIHEIGRKCLRESLIKSFNKIKPLVKEN